MASPYASFVKETSSAPGTSTFTLAGAVAGFQAFSSAFATGQVVYYSAFDASNWEDGWGVYTTSGTTLTRNVQESSNSNSAVNFTGTTTIECVIPAKELADVGMSVGFSSRMLTG